MGKWKRRNVYIQRDPLSGANILQQRLQKLMQNLSDGTKQTVTSVSPHWIWCFWVFVFFHFSCFVFDPWCPAGPLSASRGRPSSLALLPHYQLIYHSDGEQHTCHCAWMGTIWQHLPARSFPRVETKRRSTPQREAATWLSICAWLNSDDIFVAEQ